MAETLGEALLKIRTDDGTFQADMARNKVAAEQLGDEMDKTSGSSERLANEMRDAARSSGQLETALVRQRARGRDNVRSLGAQRAGLQQLSFQLNDVATMYSLGARPMQIFASQSGQVIQAVQLMTGGTSKLAAFLGGPWGIAVTSAVVVLTPLIGKLFETEDAMEAVSFASDNLGDAQDILRSVIDTTTGSIDRQRTALLLLAQAKALAAVQESRSKIQGLEGDLDEAGSETRLARGPFGLPVLVGAGPGGGARFGRVPTESAQVVRGVLDGSTTSEEAVKSLAALREAGAISAHDEVDLAGVIANLSVEQVNLGRNEALLRFLNGEATDADRELLGVDDLIEDEKKGRGSRRRERSQSAIDASHERELISVTQAILSTRLRMATSAEERAEIQRRMVEWDRRVQLANIAADEELSAAQKAELEAAVTRLADTELDAIEFAKRAQLESEAAALAREHYTARQDALNIELDLADTEAERKAIALRLLDAEEEFLRQRLLAIIHSETATEAERQRAQVALDAVRSTSGDRRKAVARANETSLERYLRELNQTPEQINEAIDKIAIDGLESLEDGLVDVIRGARSLGDVFSGVADQIIADLLRIAIQQAVIKPLAESLFGDGGGGGFGLGSIFGGGGGGGGLFGNGDGGLFGGFFASGGLLPAGQFGILGEEGPELVYSGSGGTQIFSNSDTRDMLGDSHGGFSISITNQLDATGADPAALERVRAKLDKMERDLPGKIVTTVQDARDRRIINGGDTL